MSALNLTNKANNDIVFTDMYISSHKPLNGAEPGTGACTVPLTNFVLVSVSLSPIEY
jgi:hypothetical protein